MTGFGVWLSFGIMKNANVFIDVDLTLIDLDGKLLEGAPKALNRLKQKGCHLFLWSTAGANYARKVARRHKLNGLFDGYAAKPDIIIDDIPSTAIDPFVFNVQKEASWQSMVQKIITKHID